MSVEDKQEYLRIHIVENRYDPYEFLEFLVKKHGQEAVDLSLFRIEELEKLVDEFKKSHSIKSEKVLEEYYKTSIINEPSHKNNENFNEVFNSNSNERKKEGQSTKTIKEILYSSKTNINSNEEPFTINIKQVKLEASSLYNSYFKVEVTNPEKKEGTLFSKSFINYHIKTFPQEYEVMRRFSDFEWLRNQLCLSYPDFWIPPLPFKSYTDRFENDFIEKRMRYLQKFIDELSNNQTIAYSQLFYEFISIKGDKEYGDSKKIHQGHKVISIHDIKTMSGETKIEVNPLLITELDKIKGFQLATEGMIEKINVAIRNLNVELTLVSNRFKEISGYFHELSSISEKSKDYKVTINTYKSMSNIFNEYAKSFMTQKNIIDMKIREHMNFIKRDLISLKDNIIRIETSKIDYEKFSKKLHDRKIDLLKSGNILKYEISNDILININTEKLKDYEFAYGLMLTKDSLVCENMMESFYYYLNQLISEFNRVRRFFSNNHKLQFTEIHENFNEAIKCLSKPWNDFISLTANINDE